MVGAQSGAIVINRVALTADEIRAVEQQYSVRLQAGHYWYDRACGAWGIEGGPVTGYVMPGLALGEALLPDASGGGTGVFVNSRELHLQDVATLQQFMTVQPGRYAIDAYWNCGFEGWPPLFNLAQLMRAQSGQGGAWSHTTNGFRNNTTVGGDGGDFMYISGKDHNGESYTYFP